MQDWSDHVEALVKAGHVGAAISVVSTSIERGGHQPSLQLFYLILGVLVERRNRPAAASVRALMRQSSTPPDTPAYNFALRACGGKHAMQHADQVLREMKEAGVAANIGTFSAAFQACWHSRDWQRALDRFAEMEANYPHLVTVQTWNQVLGVLVVGGKPELAITKVAEMANRKLKLNAGTSPACWGLMPFSPTAAR
ncbi:hypothetical protein JKP88DRAFT_170345 [Tribonema minus]|uniref:Pentatricopeptide repeat-containing protein n=1 Tax=Tribonema minus TaxID=303371 RepID=A0A835YM11_9STRA|nr:hypothetical protein JKP88DRAFT_170345 [Tribonema minus]